MKNIKTELTEIQDVTSIYEEIKALIDKSKTRVYTAVNTEMLNLYWNIGKIIIDIQEGNNRAK